MSDIESLLFHKPSSHCNSYAPLCWLIRFEVLRFRDSVVGSRSSRGDLGASNAPCRRVGPSAQFSWGVPPSELIGNADLRITFDMENSQNLEWTVLTAEIKADHFLTLSVVLLRSFPCRKNSWVDGCQWWSRNQRFPDPSTPSRVVGAVATILVEAVLTPSHRAPCCCRLGSSSQDEYFHKNASKVLHLPSHALNHSACVMPRSHKAPPSALFTPQPLPLSPMRTSPQPAKS